MKLSRLLVCLQNGSVTVGEPRAPVRGRLCGVRVYCHEAVPSVTLISSWPRDPAERARGTSSSSRHTAAAPVRCRHTFKTCFFIDCISRRKTKWYTRTGVTTFTLQDFAHIFAFTKNIP